MRCFYYTALRSETSYDYLNQKAELNNNLVNKSTTDDAENNKESTAEKTESDAAEKEEEKEETEEEKILAHIGTIIITYWDNEMHGTQVQKKIISYLKTIKSETSKELLAWFTQEQNLMS